jgi:nucleoside phosphorylase
MSLLYPNDWRFSEGEFPVPDDAVSAVERLVEEIVASAANPQEVYETVKRRYGNTMLSSDVSWAETDMGKALRRSMGNAPAFVDKLWMAIEDLRASGHVVPSHHVVNQLLGKAGVTFRIEPPRLVQTVNIASASPSRVPAHPTISGTPAAPRAPVSPTTPYYQLKGIEEQLERILRTPIESEIEFDDSLQLAQSWAQNASRVLEGLLPNTSPLIQGILNPLRAALVRPETVHQYSGNQLLEALSKAHYGIGVLIKRIDLYTEVESSPPRSPTSQVAPQQAPSFLNAAKGDSNMASQELLFDVAIICALRVPELEKVLKTGEEPWKKLPGNARDPQTYHHGCYTTAAGTRLQVIAAAPNQMGPPAAAALATKMILRFKPRLVAMVGIAAGSRLDPGGFGDVLSPDITLDYTSGKLTDDGTKLAFRPDPKPVHVNPRLLSLLKEWQANGRGLYEVWRNWDGPKPERPPRLVIGPLGSGSSVVATRMVVDDVGLHWRKLIGLEMEAYAVHCACRDTVSPEIPYLAFKSVCDFADGSKSDEWQPYAAYTAAASLHQFLAAEWENLVLDAHTSR